MVGPLSNSFRKLPEDFIVRTKKVTVQRSDYFCDFFIFTFLSPRSPRGLQYGWGPKIHLKSLSALGALRRLFLVNLFMAISVAFLLLSREKGSPGNALSAIGVPDFLSTSIIAEGLGTLSFGVAALSAVDTMITQVHLLFHAVHWLAKFVPIPSLILRVLNPAMTQPVFDSPHTATSLEWLWGQGWHQLFRRGYVICGALPLSILARKLGGGSRVQKICGLFGAFLMSGIMHEHSRFDLTSINSLRSC